MNQNVEQGVAVPVPMSTEGRLQCRAARGPLNNTAFVDVKPA